MRVTKGQSNQKLERESGKAVQLRIEIMTKTAGNCLASPVDLETL